MKLLSYILIIAPLNLLAQSKWERIESTVFMEAISTFEQSISKTSNYSLETSYEIFEKITDQTPIEKTTSVSFCKEGKQLMIKTLPSASQDGYMMVQNQNLCVIIDTTSKEVILQKADESFYYRKTMEDNLKLLEVAKEFYRKTTGKKVEYRIILQNGLPYESIEYTFQDKYYISDIVIYSNSPYLVGSDENEQVKTKSKVVIRILHFKKDKSVNFNGFKTVDDFILMKNGNPVLTEGYSNFELIDLRNS